MATLKPDFTTPIEYVTDSKGRNVLLLTRIEGQELTVPCPFCGFGHMHGKSDGHRVAHCGTRRARYTVTSKDGTVLRQSDGYFIKTIPANN